MTVGGTSDSEKDMGEDETEKKAAVKKRCVDCNSIPPETQTNYTLISPQHGWRVRRYEKDGRKVMEWRCPECWRAFRAQGGKLN